MSSLFRCSLALSGLCKSKSHGFYLQICPGSDHFSPRQHGLSWATATVSHQAAISALPSILHVATRGSQSNRRQIMALLAESPGAPSSEDKPKTHQWPGYPIICMPTPTAVFVSSHDLFDGPGICKAHSHLRTFALAVL